MRTCGLNSLVIAALVTAPALTLAQNYIGTSLGSTSYAFSSQGSTALEITAGVHANPALAFEISYLDLGDMAGSSWGDPRDSRTTIDGYNFSGKAVLPISRQLDVYAKAGWYLWRAQERNGRSYTTLYDGADLNYGGGLAWHMRPQFDINLEYKTFELDDAEAAHVSLGVSYSF